MTDPVEAPIDPDQSEEARVERSHHSYEGTDLPLGVILIWLAFLAFGFVYFSLHILD